jgi:ketosteroid isomerase-like protein
MSIEANKQLTAEFFARFGENDIAGVLDTMTDDATWWLAGKPGLAPTAGVKSKAQIARVFDRLLGQLKNGLKMTVKGSIAEGDQVAVQLESYGELKNGRIYNNEYHTLVTFRGERICEVLEYMDTQHVFATFFQPDAAPVSPA